MSVPTPPSEWQRVIEVEFIPIGDKTNTGDAILLHLTEPGTLVERVVLVDGGFVETSAQILSHVREYYNTTRIDLMVCTHPDADHINGLFGVLERAEVSELLIHRPSEYGYTSSEVASDRVEELIALAQSRGTRVTTAAFTGVSFFADAVRVAGPTLPFYLEQLQAQVAEDTLLAKAQSMFHSTVNAIRAALNPRNDDPGEGELTDNGGTTPRNNASIVLDVQVDGYRLLLTGDAGAPALAAAADYLVSSGRGSELLPHFFHVPHHGSRHNLTSDVMDRLAGPIVGDTAERVAFVSVGAEASDFPRWEVANAFKRRGYTVNATRGSTIRWHRGAPSRHGWISLTPLPWLNPTD